MRTQDCCSSTGTWQEIIEDSDRHSSRDTTHIDDPSRAYFESTHALPTIACHVLECTKYPDDNVTIKPSRPNAFVLVASGPANAQVQITWQQDDFSDVFFSCRVFQDRLLRYHCLYPYQRISRQRRADCGSSSFFRPCAGCEHRDCDASPASPNILAQRSQVPNCTGFGRQLLLATMARSLRSLSPTTSSGTLFLSKYIPLRSFLI